MTAVVTVVGTLTSATLLLAGVGSAGTFAVGAQRASAAADAAALAAADALLGVAAGEPCALADRIARVNGATLAACETAGAVVTVTVAVPVAGFGVTARARAGPDTVGP